MDKNKIKEIKDLAAEVSKEVLEDKMNREELDKQSRQSQREFKNDFNNMVQDIFTPLFIELSNELKKEVTLNIHTNKTINLASKGDCFVEIENVIRENQKFNYNPFITFKGFPVQGFVQVFRKFSFGERAKPVFLRKFSIEELTDEKVSELVLDFIKECIQNQKK